MESSGDSLFAGKLKSLIGNHFEISLRNIAILGKRSKLYECGKTVAAFTVFFIAGISVAIAVVALKKANDSQTQISDLQVGNHKLAWLYTGTYHQPELSGTKNFVPNIIPNLKPLFLFRSVPKFEKRTIPNS